MIRIRLDFSYKQLKKRDLMRIIIYRTKLRRGLFLNQYPFELQPDRAGNGYESEAGRLHQIINFGGRNIHSRIDLIYRCTNLFGRQPMRRLFNRPRRGVTLCDRLLIIAHFLFHGFSVSDVKNGFSCLFRDDNSISVALTSK